MFAPYFTLKDETMKRLMFLVAAVLACHSMQAQYFCTTEGTELHYVNYDEIGQSTSDETMTVSKVEKVDGKLQAAYYDKIVTTKAKNNTSYTLFNWSYDGANTVCTEDLMYGPYVDSDSDPDKYNEAARLGLLEKLKFKGDNSFTIKDGAKGGESIPDRSYQVVRNMLKNEVNVSGATKETKNLEVIAKNDINILLKNDVDIDSLEKNIEIYNNPSAPVSEGAVLGKISYTINDKTYSTDLIAANSVEATSFELIIFRIALIFLILYLFTAIFKKINNFGNKNKSKKNNIHKSIKKSKKRKSKTGGKFKFTQINEYL